LARPVLCTLALHDALPILIALAAVGVFCGKAHAQAALPGWKITDICAKESAPGQCADFERSALSAVSSSWTFVLEPIRQTCLGRSEEHTSELQSRENLVCR